MKLVFYTKPDCPLCDVVRDVLEEMDWEWNEVNIFTDPQIAQKFQNDIPVIQLKDTFWFYRDKEKISLREWLNLKRAVGVDEIA